MKNHLGWGGEGFCCVLLHRTLKERGSIQNLCANDNRNIKVEMPDNWQISVEENRDLRLILRGL